MQKLSTVTRVLLIGFLSLQVVGCATVQRVERVFDRGQSDGGRWTSGSLVEIPVVITPGSRNAIRDNQRIVIAGIAGGCAAEVRDALLVRLVDNSNYDVLSRDDLSSLLVEADQQWGGRFNSKTAVKLGELIGASIFIVGRIAYCGYSVGDDPDGKFGEEFEIRAVLQLIDVKTGKILVSSAAAGLYVPNPGSLFEQVLPGVDPSSWATGLRDILGIGARGYPGGDRARALFDSGPNSGGQGGCAPQCDSRDPEERYAAIRAAEDLAHQFADKFFARSLWDTVEMWTSSRWQYGRGVRLVQLGYCHEAVESLVASEEWETPQMSDLEASEFLHNLGVALLCSNRHDEALKKLQASYRVGGAQSTLEMMGIASKLVEWDLQVEVNQEPVVKMLAARADGRPTPSAQPKDPDSSAVVTDSGTVDGDPPPQR